MAGEDFKRYTNLEQISTEDLESILRTAALSGEELEPDLMDGILEVIVKREEHREKSKVPDARQAREEFDRLYRSLKEPLYPIEPTEESSSRTQAPLQTASKRKLRHILHIAIVAAVLAVIMALPVFGHESIFQMIAQWTEEQFSFRPSNALPSQGDKQSEPVPEEYAGLQAALLEYGIDRVIVPRYIPEGFQASEPSLYTFPDTGVIRFDMHYEQNGKHINFQAYKAKDWSVATYEKDNENVETYTIGEIEHYIFSNNGLNVAAWYADGVEYLLNTDLTVPDLKQMIDSMY